MANQATRVLELLKQFNNGQKVCIDTLSNNILWQELSESTIRKDLNCLKEAFPSAIQSLYDGNGCYKAIKNDMFYKFIDEKNFNIIMQLFYFAQLSDDFKDLMIDKSIKTIMEYKLKEAKKNYIFKNKPFESKSNDFQLIKKLEKAISYKRYMIIQYRVRDKIEEYKVQPYKIVFISGNYYVACEVKGCKFSFSLYRISKIKEIEVLSKTFHKNIDIERFIEFMQTPFARYSQNYRENIIQIQLEVDKSKAYYFKSKKYLSSQKVIEEKENGNLIIEYQVTAEIEVEELIKSWLPHIKVISPISLKRKIERELRTYLNL